MDIKSLAEVIYKEDPKAPREIQIELDTITSDVSEAFEVISLFLLEGITRKIINSPKINRDNLNVKRFIQDKIMILKQYCQSIGVDFKVDIISKKVVQRICFYDRPIFYTKEKYPFFMTFLFKTVRRGKQYDFQYNPGRSRLNKLNDGILILKIQNHHFKIQFKYL